MVLKEASIQYGFPVSLMKQFMCTLSPTPPFSLALTAGYQTYFQGRVGADVFEDGVYRRLLELDGRLFLISIRENGTVDKPKLEMTLTGQELTPSDIETAKKMINHILATEVNLQPFYDVVTTDSVLASTIKNLYGLHPPRMPTVFEGLIFAISGQQIASGVARLIRTHLVNRFGASMLLGDQIYRAFPSPHRLMEAGVEELLRVKLSRQKTEYILQLASRAAERELDLDVLTTLPDEVITERLDALHGVGRWTAEWVLIRALGRLDVFPAGDLALKRVLSTYYFDGRRISDLDARSLSERWSPFRTIAATYLFGGLRLGLLDKKTVMV